MKTSRNYLLYLLTTIMVFNYADRLAMGLLLQNIKADLHLSDTQLGFLTGIAFAVFYAGMGIPIARWADRGNRVTIISITVGLWSVAVALCGAAASFFQLLMLRISVAIGEAGCHPPAFSLIADYFDRSERPRAVSIYMLGFPLAMVVGNVSAGWLNQMYGWRATFVVIGAPGLVLALLAYFTLYEPRLQNKKIVRQDERAEPTVKEVLFTLWQNKAFRHLLFCFSLSYFFGNGIGQWQPAFFTRSHGLQPGEIGTWFGLIYGVGGFLGTWLGGELTARIIGNNERLQFRVLAVLYALGTVLSSAVYLAPSSSEALAALAVSAVTGSLVTGPLFSATQTLVPPHMRAMSIAIVLFFSNLIGLGFGPLAVGMLSDALQPVWGEDSLRFALLAMCPGSLWCAWHLWRASQLLTGELATL